MSAAIPVRLRLSRAKGFDLQRHSREVNGLPAIMVARPTKWGNPHRWQDCPPEIGSPAWARSAAVEAYEEDLRAGRLRFTCASIEVEFGGHNLACWCPLPAEGEPDCCHAAVLLRLANFAGGIA